jgi:diacylglycerol O-acyltransferase / wax synthase
MSQKQKHLDRLSSTDATFLHTERSSSHMHIGGVLLFEGPPPSIHDVTDHILGRLHLVPRYRQKLATPPLDSGRQLWIDDPSFNIDYHVRNSALPPPGTVEQLLRLAARLASQPLDRTKPLWEFYVIEGIEPAAGSDQQRFAVINKTHHALVDGIAGVDLATVLFDVTPEPWRPDPSELEPWSPQPEPSQADLLAGSLRGAVRSTAGLAARAISAIGTPARTVDTLRETAEGVGEIVWAAMNPAPETPFNVPIGPHRRFAVVSQQLSDYKTVKDAFGGTVNDVVLSVVSGAIGSWMRSRGLQTEGVELRALVPVSVRASHEHDAGGNRLVAMRGPLPVYVEDGVARLRVVSKAMDALKQSKQAVGAATLAAVTELAPPTVLAQASRIQFSTRLFNLLVTNVPGPQIPLYLLGKQLQDIYPLAFLPENQGLAVAIMSYNGKVEYGLLADFDVMPDLDVIAAGIDQALAELLGAARGETPQPVSAGAGADDAPSGPAPGSEATSETSLFPGADLRRTRRGPASDMRAKRSARTKK